MRTAVDWATLRQSATDLPEHDQLASAPKPPERMTLEELKRLPLETLQELVCRGRVHSKVYLRYLEALTAVRRAQQQAHALTQPLQ